MVSADDAVVIHELLHSASIWVCLIGGWGVDALLCEQTRPHKDLDLFLLVDDAVRMRELMAGRGYTLVELWSENLWAVDADGIETATAFVLQDPAGRQLDVHALRLDAFGYAIPAWAAEGVVFSSQELAVAGEINGVEVRCLSPEAQIRFHAGYPLPPSHVRDLELLHARFAA